MDLNYKVINHNNETIAAFATRQLAEEYIKTFSLRVEGPPILLNLPNIVVLDGKDLGFN